MKNVIVCMLCLCSFALEAQTVALSPFSKIDVEGGIDIILIPSNESRAEIEMIEGSFEDLSIKTNASGKLNVSFEYNDKNKNNWIGWSLNPQAEIKLYYDQNIHYISTSAGSSITSKDALVVDKIVIDASSGSEVDIAITATRLDVDASSGATVVVEGIVDRQDIDISSGASYQGLCLKSDNTDVDASSGACVKIFVAESLEVDASSGASIQFSGDPKVLDFDSGKWSGASISEI